MGWLTLHVKIFALASKIWFNEMTYMKITSLILILMVFTNISQAEDVMLRAHVVVSGVLDSKRLIYVSPEIKNISEIDYYIARDDTKFRDNNSDRIADSKNDISMFFYNFITVKSPFETDQYSIESPSDFSIVKLHKNQVTWLPTYKILIDKDYLGDHEINIYYTSTKKFGDMMNVWSGKLSCTVTVHIDEYSP